MALKALIEEKITEALAPSHLEVINESRNHGAGPEAESHFKLIVVSDKFDGGSQRCLAQIASATELEHATERFVQSYFFAVCLRRIEAHT